MIDTPQELLDLIAARKAFQDQTVQAFEDRLPSELRPLQNVPEEHREDMREKKRLGTRRC